MWWWSSGWLHDAWISKGIATGHSHRIVLVSTMNETYKRNISSAVGIELTAACS